jgi:FkbM family methyltransferase
MFNFFKSFFKLILSKKLINTINFYRREYSYRKGNLSFSQEGEDRVLSSLLFKLNEGSHIKKGFYIDIGAHHPHRFSNTFLFYKQGWCGINIDAMPGSMSTFMKCRPRDINLECGIGQSAATLKFFSFNEPALNTFDEKLAMARCNNVWRVQSIFDVPVLPLSVVLKKHLPNGQHIDFISIDVEGFDLEVLKSNDWEKYRPRVVLVETFGLSFIDLMGDPITEYLRAMGYVIYAKTVNTSIFVEGRNLIK